MKLLKGKTIEIPANIPFWCVARDIKELLDNTVTHIQVARLAGNAVILSRMSVRTFGPFLTLSNR